MTEVEDVSYVCSPYIPDCLHPNMPESCDHQGSGIKLVSNASIGKEVQELVKAGYAGDNVKDELTEFIKLHHVKVSRKPSLDPNSTSKLSPSASSRWWLGNGSPSGPT